MISPVIKSASRLSEVYTSFHGPMNQYQIVQYIDREKRTLRRWIVISSGKRSTLIRYLFGKLLWDNLNSLEQRVFWSLTEITTNQSIYLSLKALAENFEKKVIRKNLLNAPEFLGLEGISRQQYLTLKGRVNCIFKEETISLRKGPKFSGYTKHYKDKGSLGTGRDWLISEVLEPFLDVQEEIKYYFLTVGKLPPLGSGIALPDDGPIRTETVSKNKNLKIMKKGKSK